MCKCLTKRNCCRIIFLLILVITLSVQPVGADSRQEIRFPNIPGYLTLKCDFHMHTVFSDGLVWPTVRVDEAWREGLDCISITDHIEYTPHKDDIPKNLNRPYEIAQGRAEDKNILLIRGAEITRDTPPGHFNAIFLQDVDPLDTQDLMTVFQATSEQSAFVFWNHPGWQGPEKGRWGPVQTELYDKGWMQGIEVCNENDYYLEAHQWAVEKNLTIVGNSDIHNPSINPIYNGENHRTITLVFARERSVKGVKEALLQRRTVVWFENMLIGREEWLKPLLAECLIISEPYKKSEKALRYNVQNASHIDIEMTNVGNAGPKEVIIPAGSTIIFKIPLQTGATQITAKYEVKNFLIAPGKGLLVDKTFLLD